MPTDKIPARLGPAFALFAITAAMIAIAAALFAGSSALAAKSEIYTGVFSNDALQGYDTVAYFSLAPGAAPVKGDDQFAYDYKGARWKFSTEANLEAFKANPGAYAPQYGGYCAWAIAMDKLAKGDARYWTVVDGKLYLNFSKGIQEKWEKDIPGFIAKGDAAWPAVLEK